MITINPNQVYVLTEPHDTFTLKDLIDKGDGYLYQDWPGMSTRKILNVFIQIAVGL